MNKTSLVPAPSAQPHLLTSRRQSGADFQFRSRQGWCPGVSTYFGAASTSEHEMENLTSSENVDLVSYSLLCLSITY